MEALRGECFTKGVINHAGYREELEEGEKHNASLVAFNRAASVLAVFRSQFLQNKGALADTQAVMSVLLFQP